MKTNFIYVSLLNFKIWLVALCLQIGPIHTFITKYLFSDIGFLKWLILVMFLDLLTGIAKVIKKEGLRGVTSKGLRDTVSKCIQYGAFVIITHILTHFEINDQVQVKNAGWLSELAYEFIILIEIKSVYENIVALNEKFDFVPSVIKKVLGSLPDKYKITNEKD